MNLRSTPNFASSLATKSFEFLSYNMSRTPVNMLAPATSAAMAVNTVNGTANFANCDQSFSVDGFHHNSTAAPAIVLFAPIPIATHSRPDLCVLHFFDCDFSLPLSPQARQMIGLPVVLPEDVLHVIVNLCHWIRDFSLPPCMQCFLNPSKFALKCLSHLCSGLH